MIGCQSSDGYLIVMPLCSSEPERTGLGLMGYKINKTIGVITTNTPTVSKNFHGRDLTEPLSGRLFGCRLNFVPAPGDDGSQLKVTGALNTVPWKTFFISSANF